MSWYNYGRGGCFKMSNIIEITDDSKLIELLATGTIYVNGGGTWRLV